MITLRCVVDWIYDQPIEVVEKIKLVAENAIAEIREKNRNKRLQEAILFLAGRNDCSQGVLFVPTDIGFGEWLADRFEAARPIKKDHARSALNMLQKYKKKYDLDLPEWVDIMNEYQDEINIKGEKLDKRVEIIGTEIAVFTPYDVNGESQRKLKSVKPNKYNPQDKSWRYPLKKLNVLCDLFPTPEYQHSTDVLVQALLEMSLQAEAETSKKAKEQQKTQKVEDLIRLAKLDEPLANGWTLFKHQKEGAAWLLSRHKNAEFKGGILADDMGTGKSISTLTAAKAMRELYDCHIFVICPASLKENWLIEAEKVGVVVEVFSWGKLPEPTSASFLVIADEAHYCQNLDSARSKKLLTLVDDDACLGAWLLSGTPMKNGRPINLFPLLKAVGHRLGEDKTKYELKFCNAGLREIGKKKIWDNTGAAHLDELSHITKDVILRRTKDECLDLPEKLHSFIPIELSSKQQKAYQTEIDEMLQSYRERAARDEVSADSEGLIMINTLRKIGSRYKVDTTVDTAKQILEQGNSVVIFTEFLDSAAMLHEQLGGELLTGSTPVEERQAIVDRFQAGESKVFVGTIKAGGVGLTLTKASDVILHDRAWTPGDVDQSIDRCHRIGQKSTVTAFWIQLGDIDKVIDKLLTEKRDRIDIVMKGKSRSFSGLGSPNALAKELLGIYNL